MRGLTEMKVENLRAALKEKDRDIRCIEAVLRDMYEDRVALEDELNLIINPLNSKEGDQ